MSEGRFKDALRDQAIACEDLGSPFTATLLNLLADRLQPDSPLTRRLFNWPGDLGPRSESVPLRLVGALHALRALERCGLQDAYPPNELDIEILWGAVNWALEAEAPFISTFIDSPPQTNEVRRSVVLIAVGHWLTKRFRLPIALREVGASAGLNLMWDRYALNLGGTCYGPADSPVKLTTEWKGESVPLVEPVVCDRRGVDLSPVDVTDPLDRLRLKSYIWADQIDRMERVSAAIDLFDAQIDKADAVDWLNATLDTQQGQLTMVYSTVAWQYLPADAQERGRAIIETVGRAATRQSPLAWFQMETDGDSPGAALTLRLWPGELRLKLGRADFHGRWVDWNPPI